jgi:MFS transporter, DHA2 family, multidrug resistance protein
LRWTLRPVDTTVTDYDPDRLVLGIVLAVMMASSLGGAFGVAISAAIFTGLSHVEDIGPIADIAMGRTDNISVRFAASAALLFNVFMVIVAIIAIVLTVPKQQAAS